MVAVAAALVVPSGQAALMVSDFTISSSGTSSNASLLVTGTVSPVGNSSSAAGNWVVSDIDFDLLVGGGLLPVLPAVGVQPSSVAVLAGQDVSLTATVSGTPPFGYQWRKDGLNLPGQTNDVLTLSAVASNSAGGYDVVASTPFGSATSLVATVTVSGIFAFHVGPPTLNALTGTYDEAVQVTNTGGPITGVRLLVGNLPARVSLYNAAGTSGGLPFAQFAASMNTGDTATFVLQFFNPYRISFNNTVQVVAVAAVPPATNNTPGILITKVFMDTSIPGSPRFTFGFGSVAGNSYQVLYTTDGLRTWTAASTVTASANYTIWSETLPGLNARFFKVVALP